MIILYIRNIAIDTDMNKGRVINSKNSINAPQITSKRLNKSLLGKKNTNPFAIAKEEPEKT